MKQRYDSLDYFKLFCAFLVVCIHTEPFGGSGMLDNAFGCLTRIAVPFFFVVTAFFFFFFQKETSWTRCMRYCKRLFVLYLIWSVLYFGARRLALGEWDHNALFMFFVSGYHYLWFFHACIFAAIAMTALLKLLGRRSRWIYPIALVLYVCGCLISTYAPLFSRFPAVEAFFRYRFPEVFGTRNWLFYGIPCFAMGHWFAHSRKRLPLGVSLVGAAVCFLTLAAEGWLAVNILHTNQTILWFSMVPLTFFIVNACLAVQIENPRLQDKAAFIRKCTTWIYCIHPILILFLQPVILNPMVLTAVVFALSFLLSALYTAFRTGMNARTQM